MRVSPPTLSSGSNSSSSNSGATPNSGTMPGSGTLPTSGIMPTSGTMPSSGTVPSSGPTPTRVGGHSHRIHTSNVSPNSAGVQHPGLFPVRIFLR